MTREQELFSQEKLLSIGRWPIQSISADTVDLHIHGFHIHGFNQQQIKNIQKKRIPESSLKQNFNIAFTLY